MQKIICQFEQGDESYRLVYQEDDQIFLSPYRVQYHRKGGFWDGRKDFKIEGEARNYFLNCVADCLASGL